MFDRLKRLGVIRSLSRKTCYFLWLAGLFVFLPGCINVSPSVIKDERQKYNMSIQHTNNEQLLLNIVRLRYTDTAFFMLVNSVTSSYSKSISGSLTLGGSWDPTGSESKNLSLSGDASSSFSPIMTYQPVQGESYVKWLLAPISLNGVFQLLRSGWSISRVFRMTVQIFNDIPNALSASRPNTKYAPEFQEFIKRVQQLREIQIKHDPIYEYFTDQSVPVLLIKFPGKNKIDPAEFPLVEKLGFDFESKSIFITDADLPPGTHIELGKRKVIPIQTRSILGILYYFSKSVEVPAEHYCKGFVEQTTYPDGRVFDWTEDLTRGVISIKSSKECPCNAYVSVQYNDYWFYISENDADSKESFSLLLQLGDFQQEEGSVTNQVPSISLDLH